MRIHALLPCLLLIAAVQLDAQAPARGDTTIKGRTYGLIAAPELLAALRRAPAGTALEYRDKVVRGPLFAPTAQLDTVRARLLFADVVFLGEVALNNIVFAANVRVENTEFRGGLSALKAHFAGDLDLVQSASRKHTSFKQTTFAGRADFSGSTFAQTTSFIEAHFAAVAFAHARFAAGVYFERAHFGADADFRDAFFEDIANFKNTRWRGDVTFAGARFVQRTRFWQARFDAALDFDNARSRGEISFNQAVFSGPATFRHITFVHPARFAHAVFRQPVTFADSRFKKAAEFTGARFHAALDLNAYFKSTLDLRHSRGPRLDLLPPAGERAIVNPDSTLTDTARVYLQRADFTHLLFRWSQLAGRLASDDTTGRDLEPVYARLRHQLQARGLTADARSCFAAGMEQRRRALGWTAPEWYGLQLWRLTTAYGTDLGRLGLFAAGCVLAFALLYRLVPGQPVSLGACLYYSVLTFLRTVPPTADATGGLARLLAALQTLLGWLCLGLFLATLLGPR